MQVLVSSAQLKEIIEQLVQELHRAHPSVREVVFVGIQQGGVAVADDMVEGLKKIYPPADIHYGQLDITFYRDDIRREILAPDRMNLPFPIENRTVVLIDDVLFTGRTIKAALDVLLDYGRPAKVELCVLVDRKEHRQFPIQADFSGMVVQTGKTDKIKLVTGADGSRQVVLLTE